MISYDSNKYCIYFPSSRMTYIIISKYTHTLSLTIKLRKNTIYFVLMTNYLHLEHPAPSNDDV